MNVSFALQCIKDSNGTKLWDSTDKGFCSPQNNRPLAIFNAKESDALLQEFVPKLDSEVKAVQASTTPILLESGKAVEMKAKRTMSFVDGKMISRCLAI